MRIQMLSTIFGLAMATGAMAQDMVVAVGDALGGRPVCPQGYEVATFTETQWLKGTCEAVGPFGAARLADGGSIRGRLNKCEVFPSDTAKLPHTLCVRPALRCDQTITLFKTDQNSHTPTLVIENDPRKCSVISDPAKLQAADPATALVSVAAYTEHPVDDWFHDFWVLPNMNKNGRMERSFYQNHDGNLNMACLGEGCRYWPRGDYTLCNPGNGECRITAVLRIAQGKIGILRYRIPAGKYEITDFSFYLRNRK